MNDILSQLMANYLVWNPIANESTKYNVATEEGYQNAVELIAQARKIYDESPTKEFFDSLLEGSFVEFLDNINHWLGIGKIEDIMNFDNNQFFLPPMIIKY